MLRAKNIFLAGVMAISFLGLMPQPSLAQTTTKTCDCFCGETTGAASKGKMTQSDCQKKCSDADTPIVVCATSIAQWPDGDPWCFSSKSAPLSGGAAGLTQTSCEQLGGALDTKYQPPQCMPGSFFCYPNASNEYTLQVSIGGLVTVSDLGVYISTMYTWLQTSMVVIGIVMIMIYGCMYIFSAGSSEASKKATKGIRQVVEGLALLFCAVTLLQIVNPYLIKLQMPQIPMMRPVMLGSDSSCEDLKTQGYTIDDAHQEDGGNGNGKCGTLAPVTAGPGGAVVLEGTKCQYTTCDPAGTQCATNIEGKGICVSCRDVEPDNAVGLKPDSSVCSALDPNGAYPDLTKCFYSQEADLIVNGYTVLEMAALALFAPPYGAAVSAIVGVENLLDMNTGTCAYAAIVCGGIHSCREYDDIFIDNVRESACADSLRPSSAGKSDYDICTDDPCGVAPPNETCRWDELDNAATGQNIARDCVNSSAYRGAAMLSGLKDELGTPIGFFDFVENPTCATY